MGITDKKIIIHNSRGHEIITFASRIDMVQKGVSGQIRHFVIGGQQVAPLHQGEAESVCEAWIHAVQGTEQEEEKNEPKQTRGRPKKQDGPLAAFRKKSASKTKKGL